MAITNAEQFLAAWGARIKNDAVRAWVWSPEDKDFGKIEEWSLAVPDGAQAMATVELMDNQVQFTITERPMVGDGEAHTNDTQVAFAAIISFEDQTIAIDDTEMDYSPESIANVVNRFNERVENY